MLIFLERVVACDKHRFRVQVMRVEHRGGGDARLTPHFPQSSVLNKTGES